MMMACFCSVIGGTVATLTEDSSSAIGTLNTIG